MNQRERKAVEKYGGAICFLDKPPTHSTTKLIEMIKLLQNSNFGHLSEIKGVT